MPLTVAEQAEIQRQLMILAEMRRIMVAMAEALEKIGREPEHTQSTQDT